MTHQHYHVRRLPCYCPRPTSTQCRHPSVDVPSGGRPWPVVFGPKTSTSSSQGTFVFHGHVTVFGRRPSRSRQRCPLVGMRWRCKLKDRSCRLRCLYHRRCTYPYLSASKSTNAHSAMEKEIVRRPSMALGRNLHSARLSVQLMAAFGIRHPVEHN